MPSRSRIGRTSSWSRGWSRGQRRFDVRRSATGQRTPPRRELCGRGDRPLVPVVWRNKDGIDEAVKEQSCSVCTTRSSVGLPMSESDYTGCQPSIGCQRSLWIGSNLPATESKRTRLRLTGLLIIWLFLQATECRLGISYDDSVRLSVCHSRNLSKQLNVLHNHRHHCLSSTDA